MSEAEAARIKRCLNVGQEVRGKVVDVRAKLSVDRDKLKLSETRLEALKAQLAEVKATVKKSNEERVALTAQLEVLRGKMADDKKILSFEDKMSVVRTKQLEEEVRAYEDTLGIGMKKLADRRLQILFKHIAPPVTIENQEETVEVEHPACEIFIKVTDDDLYEVERTNPDLGELKEPIALLNKTKDIRSFLVLIRKMFCNYFVG